VTTQPTAGPEHDGEEDLVSGAVSSITVCPDGPLLVRGPVEDKIRDLLVNERANELKAYVEGAS